MIEFMQRPWVGPLTVFAVSLFIAWTMVFLQHRAEFKRNQGDENV